MTCPSCGAENQTGKYCAECGAALNATCVECGNAVDPGASFCTACGAPLTAEAGRGGGRGAGASGAFLGSRAPWVIGAAALTVVLLIVFLPDQTDPVRAPRGDSGAPFSGSVGPGAASGPGPLSSDMRTNADRLFNRIMRAAQQGNQAEVEQFMPMAIQAYGMVEDLNEDGLYHLAILQATAGNYSDARATSQRILDRSPNHILALGVAASAAGEAGDEAAAEALWNRLLEAYPEESGKPLPEYMDHQSMLPQYRETAMEATGGQ